MLQTSKFKPLADEQQSTLVFIKTSAKKDKEQEAHELRDIWSKKQAKKSAGESAIPQKIERIRQKLYNAATIGSVLPPDLILHPQDGGGVSVREVFANPTEWDGKRFADPFEPDYGGDGRIAVACMKTGNPHIYSHAHGGMKYRFRTQREIDEEITSLFENLMDSDKASPRFQIIHASEFIKGAPPEWAIKNVLPKTGLAMIFGESGAGKSFFAFDVILAIARGYFWNGYKTNRAKVLYIAAEGVPGCRARLKAYADHHKIDLKDIELSFIADSPNIHEGDTEQLIQTIVEAGGADVIVFDTLAQVSAGADENSGVDMGPILKKCQHISKLLNALVILVHHSGKNANKGSRGWSGLKAPLDTEIEIKKNGETCTAKITKQKDGEEGKTFNFKLKPMVVGIDEDGDDQTSCVVEYVSTPTSLPKADKPTSKWQTAALDAASDLCGLGNTPIPVQDIISKAIEGMPYDLGPDPKKPKRDSRRDNAMRGLNSVIEAEHLITQDNFVSFPHSRNSSQSEFCEDAAKARSSSQSPQHPIRVRECETDADGCDLL